MSIPSQSVLVAGAGAFGSATALELARRGHRVTLVDPGPLPHPKAASTDVSKMIRMDYGHDEFYTALGEQAMSEWDAWDRREGPPTYHRTGFLLLSRTPLHEGSFEGDSLRLVEERGHAVERLDRGRWRRRFPSWALGPYVDGYYNPVAGWAESGRVVRRLLEGCVGAGVRLVHGRAHRVLEDGSRVGGLLLDDRTRLSADAVVAAVGAWTPQLLPWLGDVMDPIAQPVFHLEVDDIVRYQAPGFPPWAADLSNTGWYGFPALPDGTLKIANHGPGVRADPDGTREVSPEALERLRAFLGESLPTLVDAPVVASRLCLYCDTFDSDFWIDEDPDREGLFVAAGGSGHGFKFTPLVGGIVADLLEGTENPWAHRFRWRALGARRREAARFGG